MNVMLILYIGSEWGLDLFSSSFADGPSLCYIRETSVCFKDLISIF